MTDHLCIFVCQNFEPEVKACIEAEGWQDVSIASFPSRCGRPEVSWPELHGLQPAPCTQNLLFGRSCIDSLASPPNDFVETRVIHLEQCFHLIAATDLVNNAMSDGAYLMSPGWLVNWRDHLNEMGFTQDQAAPFFQEFAQELVLLDTGVHNQIAQHFLEFQAVTGLPGRRLSIGLDHVRLMLNKHVLEWRLQRHQSQITVSKTRYAGELANHVAAMDMLTQLAKIDDEANAINKIQELFQMLFAPTDLHYMRIENNITTPVGEIPAEMQALMKSFQGEYAWTPDKQGFILSISSEDRLLGCIAVDQLAFAEQRERYLNMALAITGVCGLVIENARNRQKLLEAEKMASLGIVVAGVAHEINTPLGVGVAVVSTLKNQTTQLATQFAERKMTQSDLEGFLQLAENEMDLLGSNLGRIVQLVDTFRQVAVNRGQQKLQSCSVFDCLNDVIRSFGERFNEAHIQLHIECAPQLEIKTLTSDWVSIFTNFLDNSLKHGFKNQTEGNIYIEISSDGEKLNFNYHDDGQGMDSKSLAQMFDPFFSCDLQHGMGLGMHFVYNLITHRMSGSIVCDSQPGDGVHCFIEVPL